jgi:predicted RecA/RadA family phage recombinase
MKNSHKTTFSLVLLYSLFSNNMQARFIHDGKSIDFFSPSDIPAGNVVIQGSLVGVTKVDLKAGCLGAVAVVGVYDVVKSNVAIPLGSLVYWDTAAKKAVLTATGNTRLGIAVLDAAADDEIVRVRLN